MLQDFKRMEVFKLHNQSEFNVTLEMLQNKYEIARANTLKGSILFFRIICAIILQLYNSFVFFMHSKRLRMNKIIV